MLPFSSSPPIVISVWKQASEKEIFCKAVISGINDNDGYSRWSAEYTTKFEGGASILPPYSKQKFLTISFSCCFWTLLLNSNNLPLYGEDFPSFWDLSWNWALSKWISAESDSITSAFWACLLEMCRTKTSDRISLPQMVHSSCLCLFAL